MIQVGDLQLTRVLYADVLVPPEITGLTVEQITAVPWREPQWGEGEQLRAGAAAWVVDGHGQRIVLDPLFAADDIFHDPSSEHVHQSEFASRLERAGAARDSVDIVLLSHIEGIGMVAARDASGSWQPYFPNARIAVSEPTLEFFRNQPVAHFSTDAWNSLLAAGLVETFRDDTEIVPGLRADVSGGHNVGHTVFHIGAVPDATVIGHLAINPVHLATGVCPQQHPDPELAWRLLHEYAGDGRLLIGPLWPSPGYCRWRGGRVEV